MLLLNFTDTHVYSHNEYSRPTEDGLTSYAHEIIKSFKWVADRINHHRPAVVTHTGDFFHTTGYLSTVDIKVGYVCYRIVRDLCDHLGIPFYIIPGNHDMFNDKMQIHTLHFMGKDVIDNIQVLDVLGHQILFVPYTDDHDRVREFLKRPNYELVLSHLAIKGAVRYQGNFEDHGLDPSEFLAPTINGHYHHPSDHGDVHICGSLGTRTYHDLDSPLGRGIGLYDTEEKKFWRENNPTSHVFRKLKLSTPEEVSALRGLSGPLVNCRVYYTPNVRTELEALREKKLFDNLDLIPLPQDLKEEVRRTDISLDLSPEENLRAWLRHEDTQGLSKARLWSEGQALIHAVRNSNDQIQTRHAVRLLQVIINNFAAIQRAEIPLQGQGLTLVEGENRTDHPATSNGSAKTSGFDAIYWCFTGKSLKPLMKGNDVIREIDMAHTPSPEGCLVQTDFMVGDSHYSIQRFRAHHELGTGLKLLLEGEDISARLKDGVQEYIDASFGVSADHLRHVAIMTQNLSHRFTALSDGDKKSLIETISGSNLLNQIRDLAGELTNKAKQTLVAAQADFDNNSTAIVSLQNEVVRYQQERVRLEQEAEAKEQELRTKILQLEEDLRGRLETIQRAELASQELSQNAAALAPKLSDLDARILTLHRKEVELTGSISVSDTFLVKWQKLQDTGHCDFCDSNVSASDLANKISEATKQKLTKEQEIASVKQDLENFRLRKGEINLQLSEINSKIRQEQFTVSAGNREVSSINSQIAAHKTALLPTAEVVKRLMAEEASTSAKLLEAQAATTVYQDLLESAQEELVYAKFWYDTTTRTGAFSPSGIPSFVLDTVIRAVNESLEKYVPIFLGEKQVRLTSTTALASGVLRNKIDIEVSRGRKAAKQSSGENRKLDLCIQFALNDIACAAGCSFNILVADEIDAFLDEAGLQGLVEVLQKKAEHLSVFLTTQNNTLKSLISRRWLWIKEGSEPGISRLVTQKD